MQLTSWMIRSLMVEESRLLMIQARRGSPAGAAPDPADQDQEPDPEAGEEDQGPVLTGRVDPEAGPDPREMTKVPRRKGPGADLAPRAETSQDQDLARMRRTEADPRVVPETGR